MNKKIFLFFILFSYSFSFGQVTKIFGVVKDYSTGESLPFVKVNFALSNKNIITDSIGFYSVEINNDSDSIFFNLYGYYSQSFKLRNDTVIQLNAFLVPKIKEVEEVIISPPDELPSIRLHKKVISNKELNNKENLDSYEYELYNKIEVDINNLDKKILDNRLIKKFDIIFQNLDTTEEGKKYLPLILSESISNFYYLNSPKKKKEVVTATRITGVENIQLNQFLGDMYLDINIYDNYINIFNKSFISPIANFSRIFYKYYLEDSTFIDNKWCYKLTFTPKRSGDLTFEGEMWINDTTFAIKKISGTMSSGANINYIQNLSFEHEFNEISPKKWVLTNEKIFIDANIQENKKTYGIFIRKNSSRNKYIINQAKPLSFYQSQYAVEILDEAKKRDDLYWKNNRHSVLTNQENGIVTSMDSLSKLPAYKNFKKAIYFVSTGYFQLNTIEIGNLSSLFSFNPVEKYRFGLALRSSNKFSKRIEIGGRIAYGTQDEKLKYGVSFRANISPKKRGLLSSYYNYDIQQIGQSPNAAAIGSTFGTLFRAGPLDKLTFVQKAGINLEKDVQKDFVLFGGFEWKEFTPLGVANYIRFDEFKNQNDTIRQITTSEITGRIRWTKDEEYISGPFDRKTLTSKYPILSLQGIFGIKNLFGGNYSYQKIEFQLDHTKQIGVLGRIRYGLNAGYVFGSTAYPFLKVHETNQTYWLSSTTFNKMSFFEFISDKYIGGYIEQHFGGLFLDRIPVIKKLQWRFVSSARITYGAISEKNKKEMLLPSFTKQFGKIPYSEASIGIENIFKYGRVDLVCRLSHLNPGISPFGIRAKMTFYF